MAGQVQENGLPLKSHVDVTIDEKDLQNGALEVLKVIRADWSQDKIQFKLLTDGITNKLVGCKLQDADDKETVLVRVYGNKTDLLIDRDAETRNIILLNSKGLAPDLYATFRNGLAYRFIPGCTLSTDTVRDPKIYRLVARRMAQFHKVRREEDQVVKPMIWEKVRKFLDLVPDVFSDPEKHKRYTEIVTPKSIIETEVNRMKSILENSDNPIVFAHNDLLLGNVIYTEESNSVCFIDFEYAAFNYQAYDIGNHFAEFAGIDEVDYSKFPSKDLQIDWLKTYLAEFKGEEPRKEDIEKVYIQVNRFVLLSHLFWGIWALIQAEHSYINFDYMMYAAIRFNEYFTKKDSLLSLKLPS